MLVIGRSKDDDSLATALTDARPVAAAVASFLEASGSVVYVHHYRNDNILSSALFPLFGLGASINNYWPKSGLLAASLASVSVVFKGSLAP